MKQVIEKIINEINSKNDWTLNEKIRYAYIELGKNIHLNYEFFYSLYGLMHDEYKLTHDQLQAIYKNTDATYKVICKDCAQMLKMIFDGCNIKSEIKETIEVDSYTVDDKKFDIQHFFNMVEGDNGEQYFLSLTLDIPYIQLGMKTEHFATNVVYINDKKEQVYKGEEVKNVVFSVEKLRKIDEKIGYLTLKFDDENSKLQYYNEALNMLIKSNKKNKLYYQMVINEKNDFYKGIIDIVSEEDDSLSFRISSLNDLKVNEIKKFTCYKAISKISKEITFSQYELDTINKLLGDNNYQDCLIELEQILKKNNYHSEETMFSLRALITGSNKLFEVLDKLLKYNNNNNNNNNIPDDIENLKKLLMLYITNVAKVFINENYRPLPNHQYTNKYLENKLKIMFPIIFDFGNDTNFTHMQVGEKGIIISRIMQALFPELSHDKTVQRTKENPIENRINTCMMYDKEENLYKLLINIEPTGQENNKVLIYNFNDGYNYFEQQDLSILEMKSNTEKYMFFSKRMGIPAEQNVENETKFKNR